MARGRAIPPRMARWAHQQADRPDQPTARLASRPEGRRRIAGGHFVCRANVLNVNEQTIGYLERSEYDPSLELALGAAESFGSPVEASFSRDPLRPMSAQLYGADANGEHT